MSSSITSSVSSKQEVFELGRGPGRERGRAQLLDGFVERFRNGLQTLFSVALDYVTVLGAFLCSHFLYVEVLGRRAPQGFWEFLNLSVVVSGLYVLLADRMGLYRRETSLLNIKEIRAVFRTCLYSGGLILALSFYIRSLDLSRITISLALVIAPVFLFIERQLVYSLTVALHRRGWFRRKVVIYGAGNIGRQIARRMLASPGLGLFPVAFLDDKAELKGQTVSLKGTGRRVELPVIGGEEALQHVKDLGVEMMFIAFPSANYERNQRMVDWSLSQGLEYAIVPNSYERFVQTVEIFELGGIPILKHRDFEAGPLYIVLKRLIDFTVSLVTMVLLSPMLVVMGLLIRLDSPGPIIFKQKRVGLRGREFSFYKFRTMRVDAPQYAVSPKQVDDPRITRMGRWLRRTSLDELPQLFNVFRGDMSLVGPRPEMPFIVEKYTPLERLRLDAKPGVTGVWQISSDRGDPIHVNLEYDLFYLKNRSLLLDFAVIAKTLWSVIRGVGAV